MLAKTRLKELLGAVAHHHYQRNELLSAAVYVMTLRYLTPYYGTGELDFNDAMIAHILNHAFGLRRHAYHAVDSLLQIVKDELARHGISDAPDASAQIVRIVQDELARHGIAYWQDDSA